MLDIQLVDGRLERVEVEYFWETVWYVSAPLTNLILRRILKSRCWDTRSETLVTPPSWRNSGGSRFPNAKKQRTSDYNNRIVVRACQRRPASGGRNPLAGRRDERVEEIDGYHFEVVPHGNLIIAPTWTSRGLSARLGISWGAAGINIAFMQVDRKEMGGTAIMVLTVDNPVPEEIVKKIAEVKGDQKRFRLVEL